ncbi:hypothetical protein MSTE_02930 [Mycobacteroides stephanolepidis]|uniref:Uncharacterized protein n=1 Tax=[Mycobacterium] stephanolepidis TaxID=1520670 RepID=A0A1Z4EZ24_9MYCO|nr:hypothetical protein MSTE_02930 [[Mycobacterium] stephanolepidis]
MPRIAHFLRNRLTVNSSDEFATPTMAADCEEYHI